MNNQGNYTPIYICKICGKVISFDEILDVQIVHDKEKGHVLESWHMGCVQKK